MGKATVKLAARAVVSQDLTGPTGSASDLIHVAVGRIHIPYYVGLCRAA